MRRREHASNVARFGVAPRRLPRTFRKRIRRRFVVFEKCCERTTQRSCDSIQHHRSRARLGARSINESIDLLTPLFPASASSDSPDSLRNVLTRDAICRLSEVSSLDIVSNILEIEVVCKSTNAVMTIDSREKEKARARAGFQLRQALRVSC
jgi:hypothetical protein